MLHKYFLGFTLFLAVISCKSEYKFILNAPKKIQSNQELTISISEKGNKPIDSVQFSIGNTKIKSTNNTATLNVKDYKLGKHTINALVFYDHKTEKVTSPIYIMADTPPAIYSYKIVNTYPHDKGAYTQGLEYYNGFLYEGTGRNGESSIRKVDLTTGKVLQQKDLDAKYFGEGITIFNNKIYQLTWKGGLGFIYNLDTFEKEGEFKYTKSREGWGLTHNNKQIIKTDGTENIWFLNPETLVEESYIEAYTDTRKVENLNELEYVNGMIYANVWQQNSILIVNPTNGKVEGVANLNSLKDLILKEQNLEEHDDVLNGIAYDKENNRLFVTGKHWGKLYEIELFKKQ
ncbi:glutaminyl-peptide cyclotransferase [Lutibacter sp. HS1-25]|uniref:glutaminyl-peptide cyclotransferase n=1 Tax=Lutibacter sp. HS1-25 TaxID=2485000 RepID=UPI001013631E|nr:glutaminyl-peptide cyclotransferase [Lutibacter sp. HS1-25]RXP63327.1 glutaminyl-peptide cyclotransferase [Lutibacter sp. HS1-25]